MKKLLNSCRSQITHGYFQHFAANHLEVYSAGVETHSVNPRAIKIMQEDGIDISQHSSNHIEEYEALSFDYIITVCDSAKERCPVFPSQSKQFLHTFEDPASARGNKEEILDSFRAFRVEIKPYAEDFVKRFFL